MVTLEMYKGRIPAWCPGCGNFAIVKAFKEVMVELQLAPHQIVVVSGIGQAAKLPHYIKCNTFNGLHGRALPVATGIRLANHGMPVIVTTGDGDCYGEGGNHLMAAIRRNINVKLFVHNNQIYGLTKGQPSPTSSEGTIAKNVPFGVISEQFNPMTLAVALNCSFAARAFAGDTEHLKSLMMDAMNHNGFALIDILQPCVSFNKVNTYEWYGDRVYHLEPEYNPEDRLKAFSRSLEWGERIPIGIIYRNNRVTFEERVSLPAVGPLVQQCYDQTKITEMLRSFY
jgi:2-oxoglutarate ferredoxin oxidoreductase subunit beta